MGTVLALILLFAAPESVQELERTLTKNSKLPYEQWPREKAISALGRIGSVDSTRLLIKMLSDPFAHQRDNAVSALIQLKRKQPKERAAALRLLTKAVGGSRNAGVRGHLATALGLIGDATAASPLGSALAKESDAAAADAMATALGRLGGAVSAIALHKAAESRPVARASSIRALGWLQGNAEGEAEFIRKFEKDRDDAVSAAVIEALVRLKATEWPTEPLGERSGTVLGLSLPRMADPVVARRLAGTLLQQTSWRVRSATLTGIEERRESALLPLLVDRLERERGRLRQDVWLALRRLTGKDVPPDPEQWRALGALEVSDEPTQAAPKEGERRTVGYFGLPVVSERIAFVFDVSGSMRDDGKMDLAREHFGRTAKKLGAAQSYDLFAYRYLLDYPPRPKLERAFGKLRSGRAKAASAWLKKQPARGGGAIYDALVAAMDDPEVDTIYLLSDGVPSYGSVKRDYRVLQEVRRHNHWRRVAIHTILLGKKGTDKKFMLALATQNGGQAVDADGRPLR